MSEFLVAYFHTPLEAETSARKLLNCGVQRDRLAIHCPLEATADPNLVSAAPVASAIHAHQDAAEPAPASQADEPAVIPGLDASTTTLTVTLNDLPPIDDVCTLLKDTGAYLIDVTERNIARQYPDM